MCGCDCDCEGAAAAEAVAVPTGRDAGAAVLVAVAALAVAEAVAVAADAANSEVAPSGILAINWARFCEGRRRGGKRYDIDGKQWQQDGFNVSQMHIKN